MQVTVKGVANGYVATVDEDPKQMYVAKDTYDLAELIRRLFAKPSKKPIPEEPPMSVEMSVEELVPERRVVKLPDEVF